MNATIADNDRFWQIADTVCSGSPSQEEMDELAGLLANDKEAQQLYLAYCQLHASLGYELRGRRAGKAACERTREELFSSDDDHIKATNSAPPLSFFSDALHGTVGFFSQEMPFALLIATVVTGLGLLAGSLVYVTHHKQMADDTLQPTPSIAKRDRKAMRSDMDFVGRVSGMVDVQWSDIQTATIHGANVPLGRKYALSSGLLEITYDSGAKVILQGPVAFEVDSRDGGFLSVGKLTARLEKKQSAISGQQSEPAASMANHKSEIINQKSLASSPQPLAPNSNPQSLIPNPSLSPIPNPLFTIKTPTATVTDLGTEFGVEVSKEGNTVSHVFRGTVEVRPIARNGQRGQRLLLTANESAQVEREPSDKEGRTVHRIKVNPSVFVRVDRLPEIVDEKKLKPFRRWEIFSRGLRSDPSLLAYYDFQRNDDAPTVLPNATDNADHTLDGHIVGAAWTIGRMYGKQALAFNGVESRVDINLPRQSDDLTLTAWINIDAMGNVFNDLLMSDGQNPPGGVYWYLRSDDFRSYFNILGARGPWRFSSEFSFAQFRRWMHLAVVYDHKAVKVRFHKDGRLIDEYMVQGIAPIRIGPARIGHWNSVGYAGPAKDSGFSGRIDELAIFNRPLSTKEIQAMFEAEKPLAQSDLAQEPTTKSSASTISGKK